MVRTRFAPSPTGSLHVGNARIAALNWLYTRKHGGAFLVRIEDTDRERTVPGSDAQIGQDLQWLGLDWDEGPALDAAPRRGAYGPYRQTERLTLYTDYARRLREAGRAYDCFCTDAELRAMRDDAIARGQPARYDGRCARLTDAEADAHRAAGRAPALRFRVPDARAVRVADAVRGEILFEADAIGDFVLLRADGVPTYNFAVVVDDVLMQITHVIRGAAHLSNSPRQILLYEALGEEPPVFAHVPMVLGPDRQKLSKRHGARAVAEYRAEGYHPDALVNYLSLLSWSSPSGEEVLDRDRLIDEISLDRIGVADVVFDPQKLLWLSAQHIARMPLDALVTAVRPHLDPSLPVPDALLPAAISAIRTHLSTFGEVNEHLASFFPATGNDTAPPADGAPV
ncbi:MAG: glutamate--tRNA ligase, partial [Longimicrobiales bacterium]